MLKPKTTFRLLLLVSLTFGMVLMLEASNIQHVGQVRFDFMKISTWMLVAAIPVFSVLELVAFIGLALFWNPARTLFVIYLLGSTLVVSVLGVDFEMPGWMLSLDRLDTIATTVVAVAMYVSPFADLFRPKKKSPQVSA